MCSISGASKTHRGGLLQVGQKRPEIFVFNESYLDGSVKSFEQIDQYLTVRRHLDVGPGRFFLGINRKSAPKRELLSRQAVGRNNLGKSSNLSVKH